MTRHTRYQGLILKGDKILLIKIYQHSSGQSFWVIPGGGLEGSETEEECVIREVKEETNLDVKIEQLVFDEPDHPDGLYEWRKSFMCTPIAGKACPGYEPEPGVAGEYSITAVKWFGLRTDDAWGDEIKSNRLTYPQLVKLRQMLGF